MRTVAAVLVETGRPLILADLDVPLLQPGQVLVEVAFSGVCRTQLLECRGHRGEDQYLPHGLGHEGSGVVVDVGAQVDKVQPGDHVILSWIKGTGADVAGTSYPWNGRQVRAGGITTFARHAVISENRLTRIDDDIPMREAAMLGCAVPTGLGAVFNTAGPKPGDSLAVFGAGGIGLCAVAAASIAGCEPIVAVDVRASALDVARAMGATHTIHVGQGSDGTSAVAEAQEMEGICPGGVDFAIEASGRPDVMQRAIASVRPRGGAAVLIGNARHGQRIELDPREFNLGKRVLGTWGGDNMPDADFPWYAALVRRGVLKLEGMLERTYSLGEINEAIDDLEAGRVVRPLVDASLC
jgi:S-(hydroxymethyl)glutathione dehydrogenase/alcohol dehydrogenase